MTKQTMKRHLKKQMEAKGLQRLPNVLIAAAECMPLSKTGGLADVAGTLPAHLLSLGFDCRVITPFHRGAKEKYAGKAEHLFDFEVQLGWRRQYVGVEKLKLGRVIFYLIDNEFYYGNKIYWGGQAEGEQYAFFQRAVLEALPRLEFMPEVLHCNDWHTAVLPMLLKTQYKKTALGNIRTLLSIHNLAYQGKFDFGFVQDVLGIDTGYYTPEYMEAYGCANFLKAGCVFADRLNTVSPSYAEEICTPEYGEGLQGILSARAHELAGIVNGIDVKTFDPAGDPLLAENYTAADLTGKAACKAALLEECGMEPTDAPVIAMVTRVTDQKGFDLVLDALPGIVDLGARFVLLGTGDPAYEQALRDAQSRWPGSVYARLSYDGDFANRIYAGADLFLMPSRFEPCGISQLIAMRYGTLPIVRSTGGLKDTVPVYDSATGAGVGFAFSGSDADVLYETVKQAVEVYEDKALYQSLQQRAMAGDFSFDSSAYAYGKIYLELV